jgi:hypothetical protein
MNESNITLAKQIIYCGLGNDESVLHLGACDKDLNFISALNDFELDIQYTAVDVNKEQIDSLFSRQTIPKRSHQWISVHDNMQDFISNISEERYHWTIITGIFDKVVYRDSHYQFIFTTIEECMKFSDNVIFSLKKYVPPEITHNPSFTFEILSSRYNMVGLQKMKDNTYLFYITN